MAELVPIATYDELPEALVARSCLDAHGLVAILPEWHHGSVAWHHVYALHGLRLWTVNSVAVEAREVLGIAAAPGISVATVEAHTRLLRSDASLIELALAAAAFMLTGLPFPIWKRRRPRA